MTSTSGNNLTIIHVTPSYKPAFIYGGPTQSVSRLCEVLSNSYTFKNSGIANNTNIQVLTTTANGKTELLVMPNKPMVVDGVNVIYFNRWTKDHSHFSPALLLNLLKIIRQTKKTHEATIIHIHAWWNLVSLLSCLIAKWYNMPIVVSPRGMLTPNTLSGGRLAAKKIIHFLFGRKLLTHCTIHATSKKEKDEILGFDPYYNVNIIPNIIHLSQGSDPILTRTENTASVFSLFFISRINPVKGLELLFNGLALLKFEWTLSIAGTGDMVYINSLKDIAIQLNISHRITWLGHLDNPDKFSALSTHDLTILTSKSESFANVILESLSVGTPVLVSDQVGLSDYIKDNQIGYVCTLDPKDVSKQIDFAYQDIIHRQEIRRKAPNLIQSDFNDQVLGEQYLKIYKSALKNQHIIALDES
ncbi:XrtY-associated glycosyltransferase XYAG1 [Pedobacter sp. UBA5917]|uniref:XrtY-associated glycosyltransferase XYAG1 n=1 Tax=Pedobacter sp. UBA5917 TaxID=1947061 RepID=UPI0025FF58A1|nr:glycosyltransferase [Pedobacter sp. UBA5917]